MKRSKGFTLVELISVIVILGILIIVVLPAVTTLLNDTNEKVYESKVKEIESAALEYGSMIKDEISTLKNQCTAVSVEELLARGLIQSEAKNKDEIINPVDNTAMDGLTCLCYDYNSLELEAKYIDKKNIDVSGCKEYIETGIMVENLSTKTDEDDDDNSNGDNDNNENYCEVALQKCATKCEEKTITKVATNFYNAGVKTFKVMDEGSASATVYANASKTVTKKDSNGGESDHMYLYKDQDDNYGVITSINIPASGQYGGAYQLGSASYSATINLMTNTGVTLASYSIESKDSSKWNREYTFKPANYEIAADVEYLYVTWSADGWASIKPDSNSNYQAMFNFTISKVTVDYLPLQ